MRVLVTGAGGILGRALLAELPGREFAVTGLTHAQLDITNTAAAQRALAQYRPAIVINCAAYTRVDDAETHAAEAALVNTHAARGLAELCSARGIRIVYPSTDYVFAGDRPTPYRPDDAPAPINTYGRTKLGGEAGTSAAGDYLIIRTSWLFGGGGSNFVRTITERLRTGERLRVVNDQTGRPTYARHLARALADLLRVNARSGIYHVANAGAANWFELACVIAERSGRIAAVTPCASSEFPRPATRPAWSVLDTTVSDKLIGPLPPWRVALAEAMERGDY